MIKGITIQIVKKTLSGYNAMHEPVFTETTENVANVLVGEPSTDDITNTLELFGKKVAYTLAIPKGDTHEWEDSRITFFGNDFHSFGIPQVGIEANIPLDWNKKVTVEVYE